MRFKKPIFWNSKIFSHYFFYPFSIITLVINSFKSLVITPNRYTLPTICVGNIFIGGTGKTPLSIYIYNLLKKKRLRPAIIRKYYPSHLDEINLTKSKVRDFFFEKKRSQSILKAEQKKNNVIIMDDGLQDVSIMKDLNIVCFNSKDLTGNGFLLPAGPLRDSLKKITDCQIVVINGKRNFAFERKLQMISSNIKIYQSTYKIKGVKKYKRKNTCL